MCNRSTALGLGTGGLRVRLTQAILDVAANPERLGVIKRDEVREGAFNYTSGTVDLASANLLGVQRHQQPERAVADLPLADRFDAAGCPGGYTAGDRAIAVAVAARVHVASLGCGVACFFIRRFLGPLPVFRRCITILVLAGFFANQLAVVLHAPHDHGAMTAEAQREHDATPHFHWRGNGERYHHHHHAHRHHDHVHQPEAKTAKIAAWEQGHFSPAHDFDAVYGARWSFVLATGEKNRLPSPWIPVALTSCPPTQAYRWPHAVIPILWHPPDVVLDGSHRYLKFRHLLI